MTNRALWSFWLFAVLTVPLIATAEECYDGTCCYNAHKECMDKCPRCYSATDCPCPRSCDTMKEGCYLAIPFRKAELEKILKKQQEEEARKANEEALKEAKRQADLEKQHAGEELEVSSCSCPSFLCGQSTIAECSITCRPPKVAACTCGQCDPNTQNLVYLQSCKCRFQ
jgi:hypothetical protein